MALVFCAGSTRLALAADLRPGETVWVKSGKSIELQSLDQKLYDAPAGSQLTLLKLSSVSGKKGTKRVATVKDVDGKTYRTLFENLQGKVTADPIQSAMEMPANAGKAARALDGGVAECSTPTQPATSTAAVQSTTGMPPPSSGDCVSTKSHPACSKVPCSLDRPPDEAMRKFYPLIVQALNSPEIAAANVRSRARGIAEIHPAMIASIIAAESSGNPLVTFTEKTGRKGKGIGQYTFFEKAWSAGLDYNAPMPTVETVFGAKVNTPYTMTRSGKTKLVYSVWSPKGVIVGMAGDLSRILAEDRFITPRGKDGSPIPGAAPIEVSTIYKSNSVQAMRYLAGHHNRQDRVFQSIEESYRQEGRLPSEYGHTWGAAPVQGTPKYKLLYGQCINRCYVEKIAGLCGEAQGFFANYMKHFVRGADGKWSVSA